MFALIIDILIVCLLLYSMKQAANFRVRHTGFVRHLLTAVMILTGMGVFERIVSVWHNHTFLTMVFFSIPVIWFASIIGLGVRDYDRRYEARQKKNKEYNKRTRSTHNKNNSEQWLPYGTVANIQGVGK